MADDKNKRTDPDYKPQRGQEGNQNWDDSNTDSSNEGTEANTSNARRTNEETNTSGAGSAHRTDTSDTGAGSVGPLDADLAQKTSDKRLDRGNVTGPGLG
jgi:hypothetical protein